MLKGAKRFFLLFFSCLALFIMVLPVYVFAEGTYTVLGDGTYEWREYTPNGSIYYTTISNSTSEIRFVAFQSGAWITCYGISNSSFTFNGVNSVPDQGYQVQSNSLNISSGNEFLFPCVVLNEQGSYTQAIYYTWGEGAIAPEEDINYGGIDNLSYSSNIAGSGSAAINNFDIIKWNPVTDDGGKELPEDAIINIRAVPGKYSANSRQGLLEKLYSDFVLNSTDLVLLASISVSQEEYQVSWRSVVDRLNIPFSSINSLISTDDTWLKYGWVYECQLSIPSAEYVGEWQMVYTSTSSGVENDLTIIDNSIGISQTLINVMQNINTINDNDSIWYINDVPVNPSPEYQPPEDDTDEPWYMKILEMIYNSLGLTNQYINEGTTESNNVVNEFNDDNDDLVVNINEYDDIEDDIINDFNDNVQDLDIDNELYQNSNFISSARWISEQFMTLISDNPIGSILKFSLIFGFILIFLGRFR